MKVKQNKCPSCGPNKVKYDGDSNKYTCNYCQNEYEGEVAMNNSKNTSKDKSKKKVNSAYVTSKKVAVCGIFGGLSLLLYLVEIFRIPMSFIFSAAPFLRLNFSDVPVMIAGFCYGPVTGGIIVLIKFLVKCMMTRTGFIGELADLIVSLAYILPAAIIYLFKKNKKGALIGMGVGTIVSTIVACFTNYFILLPMYNWQLSYTKTILAGILPFNFFKNILISLIVFLIYKKISNVIAKYGAK
jgi:riboflavin transporter FmnP